MRLALAEVRSVAAGYPGRDRWPQPVPCRPSSAQAERALDYCEVPVGCVIVKGEDVIATGFNLTNETCDVRSTAAARCPPPPPTRPPQATRHAELVALDAFFARNEVAPDYFADCVLSVVSLRPPAPRGPTRPALPQLRDH